MRPSSQVWKNSLRVRRGFLSVGSQDMYSVTTPCTSVSLSRNFSTASFDFSFGRKDKQKVSSDNTNEQARRVSPDNRIFTCASHCNFTECHRILQSLSKEGKITSRHFQRYFEGAAVGLKKVLDNTEPNGVDIQKASGDLLPTIQFFLKEHMKKPRDIILTDALVLSVQCALEIFTPLAQIEAVLNIFHAVKYKHDYLFVDLCPGKISAKEMRAMQEFRQQIKGEIPLAEQSPELTNILDEQTILLLHDQSFEQFLTAWVRSKHVVRSPELANKPHFGKEIYMKVFDIYKRSPDTRLDSWIDFYVNSFGPLPRDLLQVVLASYARGVSSITQVSLGNMYHDSFVMLTPEFMVESFCKEFMPHTPTQSLSEVLYTLNSSCTKAMLVFDSLLRDALENSHKPSLAILVDYLTVLTRSIVPVQTVDNLFGTAQVQECSAGHSLTARLDQLRVRNMDVRHKNLLSTRFLYLPNVKPSEPTNAALDDSSWPFVHSDSDQYAFPSVGSKPNILNREHHDQANRSYRLTLANPIDAVLSGTPLADARRAAVLHRNQVLLASILTTQQTFLLHFHSDLKYAQSFDEHGESIKQVKSVLIEALLRADQPSVAATLMLESLKDDEHSKSTSPDSQFQWKQWNIYELSSRLHAQYQCEQNEQYKEGFQSANLLNLLNPQTGEFNLWLSPLAFVPVEQRSTLYGHAKMLPEHTLDNVYSELQQHYNDSSTDSQTHILTNVPNVYDNYELVGVYACQTGDVPLALAIYTRLMSEMTGLSNGDVIYGGKLAQFCTDISMLLMQIPTSRVLDAFGTEKVSPPVFPGILHPELRSVLDSNITYDDVTCMEMLQQAMTILGVGVYNTKYGVNTSPTLLLALCNIASYCGDIKQLTALVNYAEKHNVMTYIAQWLPTYYAVAYIQLQSLNERQLTKHSAEYYTLIESVQADLNICVENINNSDIDPLWQLSLCSDHSGYGSSQHGLIKLNPERTNKHLIRLFSYGVDKDAKTNYAHLLFDREKFSDSKHGTIMDSIKNYPQVLRQWVQLRSSGEEINDIYSEAKFFRKNLPKYNRDLNLLKILPYLEAIIEGRYVQNRDILQTSYSGAYPGALELCQQAMQDIKAVHLKSLLYIGEFYHRKTNILPIEPHLLMAAPSRAYFSPLVLISWLVLAANTRPMEGVALLRDLNKVFSEDVQKAGFVFLPEVLLVRPNSTKWADSTGETFEYDKPTSAVYFEYELYFRRSMLLLGLKFLEKHKFKMAREMLLHSVLGIDNLAPIIKQGSKAAVLDSMNLYDEDEDGTDKLRKKLYNQRGIRVYLSPYLKSLPKIAATCPFTAQEMLYYTTQIASLFPFSLWLVQQSSQSDVFTFMHGDVPLPRAEQDEHILRYVTITQLSAVQSVLHNTQKYICQVQGVPYDANEADEWIYGVVKSIVKDFEEVKLDELKLRSMPGFMENEAMFGKEATEDHILARLVYMVAKEIVHKLAQDEDKLLFAAIQAAIFTRLAATSVERDRVVLDVVRRNTTVSMSSISLLQQLKFVGDTDPQAILQGSVQGALRNYMQSKIVAAFSDAELCAFVNVIISLGDTGMDNVDSSMDDEIEQFWFENGPKSERYRD